MSAESSEIRGSAAQIEIEESWVIPPFQPLRALGAALLTGFGFGLYEFVLVSFWSAPWMGIHDRIPWPAFAMLAVAMLATVMGIRLALSLDSPHAKMGFGLFAFLACVVVGMGGGRFVSYTMRGTLNPPYKLSLAVGQRFPAFALSDQNGAMHRGPAAADPDSTLIYVYRGDFCPFARFELADLSRHGDEFRRARIDIIGISADPIERSKMLAGYLHTEIPLLSDAKESVLAPLGLVQRHVDGQPDNAIPAFFVVDRDGVVRWIFTSRYYRELPTVAALLDATKTFVAK